MDDNSSHSIHSYFGQAINILSNIPTPIPEVERSSQSILELAYEVFYKKLWVIRPIIQWFVKSIDSLPISHDLPHHPKKK